jgi:hypothetical protein
MRPYIYLDFVHRGLTDTLEDWDVVQSDPRMSLLQVIVQRYERIKELNELDHLFRMANSGSNVWNQSLPSLPATQDDPAVTDDAKTYKDRRTDIPQELWDALCSFASNKDQLEVLCQAWTDPEFPSSILPDHMKLWTLQWMMSIATSQSGSTQSPKLA